MKFSPLSFRCLQQLYSLRKVFVTKLKFNGELYPHFIFVCFFIFSIPLPALKDQFTVLIFILKFGNEDFTDPGLLKSQLALTGLSQWFCSSQVSLNNNLHFLKKSAKEERLKYTIFKHKTQ